MYAVSGTVRCWSKILRSLWQYYVPADYRRTSTSGQINNSDNLRALWPDLSAEHEVLWQMRCADWWSHKLEPSPSSGSVLRNLRNELCSEHKILRPLRAADWRVGWDEEETIHLTFDI